MVRVFLKGGVWKNSEDEILKAAVQKYGKQQWARVASLLNRKTAKQAKARWHEWLDPAIRKTEWSRAEEEKLLHLAKLLPAQWKTIAPMVGRTAVQCQEHYEFLLDQASAAAAGSSTDNADDANNSTGNLLRQQAATSLRPGQIDSHPETKPAKPDPIDMDEDEMEMLQEARARLANTQGKKAKRKQRERILAQAKRLADLQKRRELKQAGLLSQTARKKSSKRKNEIDFGVEIPFHKPAPAGLHDVSTEDARADALLRQRLTQVNYQKVNESQYRTRDREAEQAKRREQNRLRILEESNEKYASVQKKTPFLAEEELPATAFRGPLQLPAPTVSDVELAQRAKLRLQQRKDEGGNTSSVALGGTTATQTLLGDYSSRPLPTPMRGTSATTADGTFDIMREASQLRRLERSQTPLLLSSAAAASSTAEEDYDDDTMIMADSKLPAVADQAPDRSVAGRTPSSVTRDELGLNRSSWTTAGDDHSVGGSTFATTNMSIRELARQERRVTKRARAALEAALMALPAPQYEYELSAPFETMVDDYDDGAIVAETVPDQADVEAAQLEGQRLEAEKLYQARNSVVKRQELPRPPPATTRTSFATVAVDKKDDDNDEGSSQKLIDNEMRILLQYDAYAHPVTSAGGTKKSKKRNVELMEELQQPNVAVALEALHEDALNEAKNLILVELEGILEEKVNAAISNGKAFSRDGALEYLASENARVSAAGAASMVFLPNRGGWVETTTASDEIQGLHHEFAILREATAGLKRKHDKVAAKLSVTNGGYVKRGDKLQGDILQTYADLQNSKIEETIYKTLQSQETRGGENRIERLKTQIRELRNVEAGLQKRYGDLVVEKRRLQVIPALPCR